MIIVLASVRYLFVAPAGEPPLRRGNLQRHAFSVDGLDRAFLYYLPAELRQGAPVVLVFHSSRGGGERIQQATAYAFDLLADQYGFVAVYPNA